MWDTKKNTKKQVQFVYWTVITRTGQKNHSNKKKQPHNINWKINKQIEKSKQVIIIHRYQNLNHP